MVHLESWLSIDSRSSFSLANIPFGMISTRKDEERRPAIAIGDYVLDLKGFANSDGFSHLPAFVPHQHVFSKTSLNAFAALGRSVHRQVRRYLQDVLTKGTFPHVLESNGALQKQILLPMNSIKYHLPMVIGDYTDFYAGRNHAYNVGLMFRGHENALQPNYAHLPVAYHGRSSSIVISGTSIKRPSGQILPPGAEVPILSTSRKLDMELELAAFICTPNELGTRIPTDQAEDHIFGFVLMNDWSARDIQTWEYVPLGPFLAKNFATTISPWVVLVDALEPFLAPCLEPGDRDTLLPYLRESRTDNGYDIRLSVDLKSPDGSVTTISRTNARHLLYSFPQMVAHHTVNGCALRTGDLLGSGTISGTEAGQMGALLEMTWNGNNPVRLENGEERTFLLDGDEVIIRGVCGGDGGYVGFGDCKGTIV